MNIGLDMMGGDYAPLEAIKGVKQFFDKYANSSAHLVLIGDYNAYQEHSNLLESFANRFTWVPSTQVIEMNEHPTKAFKEKPESSITIGFGLLAKQKIDAFISAGNTGAMLVGAMYSVKQIEGLTRPTIATFVPRQDGKFNLLLDVGVNADCKPEHLVHFAQLGSIYLQKVMGITNPRVSLLNLGEEEGKGNLLAQATYPLLKEAKSINFIGNTEGRDIFSDKADIFVCEGFVGNIVLKLAESVYHIFKNRGVKDDFLDSFNYEIYGGTPLLGVNAPIMIGHGISSANAFENMIYNVEKIINSKLIEAFQKEFKLD